MKEEHELREASENYLEAILRLEDTEGRVRSVDVANELGVSRPSVNKAVGVLKKAAMVEQQPYGHINLTPLGREKAEEVLQRHRILRSFLIHVLGVNPTVADEDACRMEHVVSEETMAKLIKHFGQEISENMTE